MSKEKRYGMNRANELGIMNYCEFIKCSYGEARFDLGGCGIAWSGDTCYTLYNWVEDPKPKFTAFEIHLEETRLNNE